MRNLNDLIISAIVAVVAWLTYDSFGVYWALAVLIVATIGFIWWHSRRGSDER